MSMQRSQKSDDSRDQRLKAALKANIARRKAQARARLDQDPAPASGSDPDRGHTATSDQTARTQRPTEQDPPR